ncbi:uncharacterized protein B0H18DRAFT_381630 [Fomitopsis serialis]|uniref:uncharacterized protein n=1 Tax=Fomitopsis serialis TaxID=139415 RepID=UPI002008BDC8|nr:uncharacterized protein B0H18DRAFT_381630 [Neoantrodia serialis]KAH9925236.1 hypothetical protein B0H18DRAFT_381630 [Neoantrodia serialis]
MGSPASKEARPRRTQPARSGVFDGSRDCSKTHFDASALEADADSVDPDHAGLSFEHVSASSLPPPGMCQP